MAVRSDLRTRVRDYIYEGTADLVTDTQLNRLIAEEVNSLPSKDIYLEYLWSFSTADKDIDYPFTTGVFKIEKIEINDGTSSDPAWVDFKGWDVFDNTIYLNFTPSGSDSLRAFTRKAFTEPTDDTTALDVPTDKLEVVVWGVVVRVYKLLIGYFRQAKNWDSIGKPDGVSLSSLQGWLRDAQTEYNKLIEQYKTVAMPRDIDLVT